MIHQRWKQFLFGFYPSKLYWRPTLAFVLMLVALAPVLFSGRAAQAALVLARLPRRRLLAALGRLADAADRDLRRLRASAGSACRFARRFDSSLISAIAAVVGTLIWWFFLAGPVARALGDVLPLTLTPVASKQFGGFMLSIVIGMTGIAFSLPLGVLLALGRRSDMFLVKSICVGFIEFIRGVPLITLLLVADATDYWVPEPGRSRPRSAPRPRSGSRRGVRGALSVRRNAWGVKLRSALLRRAPERIRVIDLLP